MVPARYPTGRLVGTRTVVDGLCLHALAAADPGPARLPVVLIHGLGVSGRYLVPTAARLAPRGPVYAPDLPGFGASDRPARALDMPELADWLAAWLAANNLALADFLGNSLGCQIIAELAARRPALVARAIFVGPTIDRHARTARQQLWRLLRDASREGPLEPLLASRDYLRFGLGRGWRTLRFALADRIEEKLPRIQAPTLVVRGERDPLVPPGWAEEVAHLLPRGHLVVLPGAAHAANFSAPDALLRAILPFLDTAV